MEQRLQTLGSDPEQPNPILASLVAGGNLSQEDAQRVHRISQRHGSDLRRVLLHDFGVHSENITMAIAKAWSIQTIDPNSDPPDPRLIDAFGPKACLEFGVLPWRSFGDTTQVLVRDIQRTMTCKPALEAALGQINFGIAPEQAIIDVIQRNYSKDLAFEAENALSPELSCRNWNTRAMKIAAITILVALLFGTWFWPTAIFNSLFLWLVVVQLLATALKFGAILMARPSKPLSSIEIRQDPKPTITLLVPLFKEHTIASRLIENLSQIDYPKSLLDACLIVESDDETTLRALDQVALPTWIRIVVVPAGTLRTKPRALNYALNFAHGSIIGVFDAEDAPDRDQLRTVAATFANVDQNVACVQGTLDYYNPDKNWLSRCFAIEYASWFRVILPGYARMKLVVPLGGTTLFFRREVLEDLGGWDAHNVTEDADLGLRLARQGYKTVFMPSTTKEEANARAWPWIKQRSRWLKGYAITYAVHMRQPRRLLRELGAWRFLGVQILFLGTLSQFLLAPLLWTIIIIPFGYDHPILHILSDTGFWALSLMFLAASAINLFANCLGVARANKRWLMKWTPTLLFYFPLATFATLKALFELVSKPFYWDKTMHGVDPSDHKSTFSASSLRRIS